MKRGRILRLTNDRNGYPITFVYKITCFSVKVLYAYTVIELDDTNQKSFHILYNHKDKN